MESTAQPCMKKLRNTAFNRFNIYLVVQVLLIAATPLLIILAFVKRHLLITPVGLLIIWILQIIYLVYYLGRTNRDLARFLFAFKHDDSTMVFNSETIDSNFRDLHTGFNNILNSFEEIKIEKEKDSIFFQKAIEHVGIGILSYNQNDRILLINKAFKELFGINNLRSIDNLGEIKPELPELIKNMRNGDQKLVKIADGSKIVHLSIKVSDFKLINEPVRIITFQNIKNEIEQNEMDAWQKLIRVLTHEIMNSVSPVTLLSRSLIERFEEEGKSKSPDQLNDSEIENLLKGLKTINLRSRGLAKFVEDYRNLTQLPNPNYSIVRVSNLFDEIETLFSEEMRLKTVRFEISSPGDLELSADKELLEQVLINLIRNSIQATKAVKSPEIRLTSKQDDNHTLIKVADNGIGIPEDQLESIFIPFFTTKKDGSGIGLSLARQVMRLHNGTISVESTENKGAAFTLQF